jgi:hypothetical protein
MKRVSFIVLALALWLSKPTFVQAFQGQSPTQVQACKTEEAIVLSIKQDLADTVSMVKKETLDDFQKSFHQQACTSKLSICLQTVQDLLTCLDKAIHDPGSAKADVNTSKAKQATYSKLKAALQEDIAELKATKDPKTAKDDIEKFDFSH